MHSKTNLTVFTSDGAELLLIEICSLQVKAMCKATFVEFNLPRITSGLTLSFLHLCLLTVLALVPKNLLLRRFIR